VIWEAFRPGTEPNGMPQQIVQGENLYGQDAGYGSVIPLDQMQGQVATDSLPDDGGTSILDIPNQSPQLTFQQPTLMPGESANPADYHPTNVAPPGMGLSDAASAPASAETPVQEGMMPNQIGDSGAPPPLPSSVDGLSAAPPAPVNIPIEDLTKPLDPAFGGPGLQSTPAPAASAPSAPADSSDGLY
jgi:penicillin-binding protein 1A